MQRRRDAGKGSLAERARKALREDGGAASFASILYAHQSADGLDALDTKWLAANAQAAAEFIASKPQGAHKVGVRPSVSGAKDSMVVEMLNDDMPFLVDSILGEVQARGLTVGLLLHPIFQTTRSADGQLKSIAPASAGDPSKPALESYIALHLPNTSEEAANGLAKSLASILDDVRVAVADWQAMRRRVVQAIDELRTAPVEVPREDLDESIAFLKWVEGGNFTFLGVREFQLEGDAETGDLVSRADMGLGLLRNPNVHVLRRGTELVAMTAEIRRFFFARAPLLITKANVMSRVHRRVHMDYVGVKTYRPDGTPKGELRIVGLLTAQAYVHSPVQIPILRQKVAQVLASTGYPPQSHSAKSIANILDTFPRDELFQIGTARLKTWVEGILDLETRPRVRAFVRVDRYDRFVSALIYVPRERYNSHVRERIGAHLAAIYKGRLSAFYPYFPAEGPLVRVQFIIGRYEGVTPAIDGEQLERDIGEIIRTWDDRLGVLLGQQPGDARALHAKYANAFSAGYSETFSPARAIEDIKRIERLSDAAPIAVDFYREADTPAHRFHAAIYRFGTPIKLSERVPLLENFGFQAIDERSYVVMPRVGNELRPVTLHDMVIETADAAAIELRQHDRRLEAAFLAVFADQAESDGFNRLVVAAHLDWREVFVLRAYGTYLRQLGTHFTLRYQSDTLTKHATITRDLVELFHVRFDPDRAGGPYARKAAEAPIRERIETALAAVPVLDEDLILRQYLNLIGATVRTNYYQRDADGRAPATLAMKFDSKAITSAPEPRPFREIWVASPRVEGIHLRFAPIARGGIRWSDRAQDFRTEVLGLVKAQLVKNAVIVPSGAKGGFYPKRMPRGATREEVQAEGIAAYRIFIGALLSVTDNLKDGRIVPPARVVRHDSDDAYLVVAADKGTATFSDVANAISVAHGFWLGDAFASGGSAGYDHKRMAITARGAWECVKRHFREMDVDIQTQAFTAVGVGDMSGDVFGNGMLLSPQTRLVAAFDHRDIFIDPNPDPAKALAERSRLFNLPRSSWQDYDKGLISVGGGVFSRGAKAIPVTAEMKKLLDLETASVTPVELMRAVLKARADLLFFGGIGTYVRASGETDLEVGDKSNDSLRIAGADLRVKVVGEGANLGMTQRGRIEFAQRGGRLNTDFIDNSAGVNTSDQEVNIKIALGPAVRSGKLGIEARNALLVRMTDAVGANSLRNNYQQSLALSLAQRDAARTAPELSLLMRALEARGLLVRRLEALPGDAELAERGRKGSGLTRPELAVLLSYAKIALSHDLLNSKLLDEPQLGSWLDTYFPQALHDEIGADIAQHSLRREIVTTGITNAVINRCGPAFAVRVADETKRSTADVAKAFLAVREIFELPALWQRLDGLDNKVAGATQNELYAATQSLLQNLTPWFLREGGVLTDFAGTCTRHKDGLAGLRAALDQILPQRPATLLKAETARLVEANVPADIAEEIAGLAVLDIAPAATNLAQASGTSVEQAGRIFLQVGERLRIDAIRGQAARIPALDYYDRIAITQAIDAMGDAQSTLARAALRRGGAQDAAGSDLGPVERMLAEISGEGALTVSRLVVASRQLAALAQASEAAAAPAPRKARTNGRAKPGSSESRPARKPAPLPRS